MKNRTKSLLILKVVPPSMETQNGFVWPTKGDVECPDWKANKKCGNGLHGWMWTPSCNIANSNGHHEKEGAKWLVVRVQSSDLVDLGDKVKFRRGTVIFCGSFEDAIKKIQIDPTKAGFNGTATAGTRGTATAGDGGTATAGDGGTATAGTRGTATAGDGGTATAGYGGTISIEWWDQDTKRYRRSIAEIGITPGIDPGKTYRVKSGVLVEVVELLATNED